MDGIVVVGYDESLAGERALAVAVREAALHEDPLEIVNVFPPAPAFAPQDPAAREAAEWITSEGARTAHELCPGVPIETRAVPGRPDDVLAEESDAAELLVLGDRKHHGFTTLQEGAVTARVLDKATCPVLVLSPKDRPPVDRMTVAVDLDDPTGELLGFAFAEAARQHAALHVVNIWDRHLAAMDYDILYEDELEAAVEIVAERDARLDAVLAPWRTRYPDLVCTHEVRMGAIGQALIDATGNGDLLVVGGRRHAGGGRGMEIGPAVHSLLHHAECPLAIVPIG